MATAFYNDIPDVETIGDVTMVELRCEGIGGVVHSQTIVLTRHAAIALVEGVSRGILKDSPPMAKVVQAAF
ncbi:MAG: hypothetical protein AAFQ67_08080 [Pseudomonadota bacterium]